MSERAVIPSRNTFLLFTFFFFGFVLPQSAAAEARPSETYGRLPLHFEANRGQTHDEVRFLARGPGYSLYLTAGEAVLVLAKPNADAKRDAHATRERPGTQTRATPIVVRMSLVGAATKPLVSGLDELPGKANYFIGKDPAKWRTNVPTYAKVRYQEVYPGIDLVYYGNQRRLEYDFLVAPGADPNGIVIGFQGAERLEIDAQGELVLHVAGGVIRQRVPVIYQETDGVRTKIEGRYVLKDAHRVGFQVTAYDRSQSLVIDPVLVYSTYLGGSGSEQAFGIAVDAAGAAYVTGFTTSADFTLGCTAPCTVLDATLGGFADAFVAKLNATGTALVYSTYLGGSGDEFGLGIAVDAAGAAYVTGVTQSTDFTAGCTAPCTVLDAILSGGQDAFVTKLDPTGSALLYSTYLGGSGSDHGSGIAVDAAGAAYVTGFTFSADFTAGCTAPCTVLDPTLGGGSDAFVTKLDPTGSALLYSTYLGGSADDAGVGIAVDAAGAAYVTGVTQSTDFTAGCTAPCTVLDPTLSGGVDAFVTKLDPTGSALLYSTYLGGSGGDSGLGIAVDAAGAAYVTGFTTSADFTLGCTAPCTVLDATLGGFADAFVAKLNATGTALVYSTYLGGTGEDFGYGIALDTLPSPNAYVVGGTASTDFPTTPGAFQISNAGSNDAFIAKITNVVPPPPPDDQCPPSGEGNCEQGNGGGNVNEGNGDNNNGNFSFIVQRKIATQRIYGDLQYTNSRTGTKLQSTKITSLLFAGNTATFSGTCTNNGAPCVFTVNVTDSGPLGAGDIFTLSISGGPMKGGTLRSGDIVIRR